MALFKYQSKLVKVARRLRLNQTNPEKHLWFHLRNRKLDGYKFRRQFPIAQFIIDFYCQKKMLGVEIDGQFHHDQWEKDKRREKLLYDQGIKIIRFSNNQVINRIEDVLVVIRQALQMTSP